MIINNHQDDQPAIAEAKTHISFAKYRKRHNEHMDAIGNVKNRLRLTPLATAQTLIKFYIRAYKKGRVDQDGYFETSNALISDYIGVQPKTVWRAIKRLQTDEFGIKIIEDKIDGDAAAKRAYGNNYLIKLNPYLIEWVDEAVDLAKTSGVDDGKSQEALEADVDQQLATGTTGTRFSSLMSDYLNTIIKKSDNFNQNNSGHDPP